MNPAAAWTALQPPKIDDLLLRQKAVHNTTVIVVTHDVRGARRVGDRVAVLDQGRVVALGTPEEVEHSENEIARNLVAE